MSDDVNDLDEILQVLKLKKGHANKQTLKDYIDLLFKWHEKNNILSTRNRKYFLQRDMHDSLSILNYLPQGNVLDIGTGAGIPGMLLSFFITDNIILLDRRQNAIRFLEHAKLKLGLNNVRIIKSDINEMNIDESLSCVLIKNFSNKIVSKLSFEDKINDIYEKKLQDLHNISVEQLNRYQRNELIDNALRKFFGPACCFVHRYKYNDFFKDYDIKQNKLVDQRKRTILNKICTIAYYKCNNCLDTIISCLLYTSPSPRDRTRSRMPSSA